MTKPKIVLGLSGGVDSAVSARLLQENYTVIALYLSIGPEAAGEADARAVAEELGIEFHTMNISEALERHVKAPFASDYLSGRTPLPCARCNPLVKFPSLLALAKEVGADYISTGHYARVEHSPAGRTLLKKGQPSNDQSYMLAQLPQGILQKVIFPLGNYNKDSIRAKAEAFGILVAHKPDSMEICFIPDNDYAAWLVRRGGGRPRRGLHRPRRQGAGPARGHPPLHSGPEPGAGGLRSPPVLCVPHRPPNQYRYPLRRHRPDADPHPLRPSQLDRHPRSGRPPGGHRSVPPRPDRDPLHHFPHGGWYAGGGPHPRPSPHPRPAGGVL